MELYYAIIVQVRRPYTAWDAELEANSMQLDRIYMSLNALGIETTRWAKVEARR